MGGGHGNQFSGLRPEPRPLFGKSGAKTLIKIVLDSNSERSERFPLRARFLSFCRTFSEKVRGA